MTAPARASTALPTPPPSGCSESAPGSSLPFIHPHISIATCERKGRLVRPDVALREGETVLIDAPYALVPGLSADAPPFALCSRHGCQRRLARGAVAVACGAACAEEVKWCSDDCRALDRPRHGLECGWLRRWAGVIREAHGGDAFLLVWLIARMLINRALAEMRQPVFQDQDQDQDQNQPSTTATTTHLERRGWDAVWNLEGTAAFFPDATVARWRALVDGFLSPAALGVGLALPAEDVVELVCKVETNSFGLYPGVTGRLPATTGRGDYYGGGVWPTAAMFNHACCPNITHRVDDFGRRIFQAARDIEPGEECCISYFDLHEHAVVSARRRAIRASWDFDCDCRRCEEEMAEDDDLLGMLMEDEDEDAL